MFKGADKHFLQMQLISKRSIPYANPRYNTCGVVWGKCYRTDFLKEHNLFFKEGITVNEDSLFNLYAIEAARAICYFSIPLYHYRKNSTSVMNTFKWTDWDNTNRVIQEIDRFMSTSGCQESFNMKKAFEFKIVDASLYLLKCYVFHSKSTFDMATMRNLFEKIIDDEPYLSAISRADIHSVSIKDRPLLFMEKRKCFIGAKWYVFVLNIYKAIRSHCRLVKSC